MADGGVVDPVAALLAGQSDPAGVGTILHLGAGQARALDACLATGAAMICLVEPNPALAQALRSRIADEPRVQVQPVAVAARDGRAQLRLFNMGPLSSLRAPADLTQLYPGLRELSRAEVATQSLDSLLAGLPALASTGEAARDILVIEAPGEEEAIVAALLAGPGAARFGQVLLNCGTTPHYHGSVPINILTGRLTAAGYRLVRTWDDDPDRPWQLLARDPRRLGPALLGPAGQIALQQAEAEAEITRLTSRIAALEADLGALARNAAQNEQAHAATITALTAAAAAQSADETAALRRLMAEVEAERTSSTAQHATELATRDAALAALSAAADESASDTADLRAVVAEMTALQAEVAASASASVAAARLTEVEAERDTARNAATEAAARLAALQAETTALKAEQAAQAEATARQAADLRARLEKTESQRAATASDLARLQTGVATSASVAAARLTEVEAERDTARNAATEAAARLAALWAEQAAQAKAQAQAAGLDQAQTALQVARTEHAAVRTGLEAEIVALRATCDSLRNRDQALQQDIAATRQNLQDRDHALALAGNELRRAEGQLDLIKDLLLGGGMS